ncbi:MAG TPA: DUF484 family protein [Gammaproteobacteria bacterium]|nr:DUF484 family protein [Gammaproteobacteria bacterium]
MTSSSNAQISPTLSDEDIAAYLRLNPDFFERHESLLAGLSLPHDGRGAISLVEHQMILFRRKNQKLESKLLELMHTAKENESLSTRLFQLSLALIEADNLDDVVALVRDQLINGFKTDLVTIGLFDTAGQSSPGLHEASREDVTRRFKIPYQSRRPQCGALNTDQMTLLFGEQAATIHSAALIPLFNTEAMGYIALGSHEPSRFRPGMGVMFLGNLGALVSSAIHYHQQHESAAR